MHVPAPTMCPTCRMLRRLSYRNELNLHSRKCDLCDKSIVSVFSKDAKYTVYCNECWNKDTWDPFKYGVDFDFNKPFFEQYYEMILKIPRFALFQDGTCENCEYVNYGMFNKSCYLIMGAASQDVYYTYYTFQSKSSSDCTKIVSCELCYECTDCTSCYNIDFSHECSSCSDSSYLYDCKNCQNCFCSAGLRSKKFVFENKQFTEDEYKKRLFSAGKTSANNKLFLDKLEKLREKIPHNYIHGSSNENVTGDYIDHCKNVQCSFDCLELEDSNYCDSCVRGHDMFDCSYSGLHSVQCYEMNGTDSMNNSKFIFYARTLSDCEYCQYCNFSRDLFGCFGLDKKQYCVFNKQYSKDEYFNIRGKIIDHMKKTQEYGEYFPAEHSTFSLNESSAFIYKLSNAKV